MKIEKTRSEGIRVKANTLTIQVIYFDTEHERDVVFEHWSKAIEELNVSKAIYRPVYEDNDGETRILKLRYTTPEEVIRVENERFAHFGGEKMKLIMIYNEQERTFQNVNN